MMKIFYNVIILCILISSFCYCESHTTISERTTEELYVTIDETVNPDDFKPYDLYKVYKTMFELEGRPYYTEYVDSIYVKEITDEKIIFNYVWQEEWRNIEKGYYIFPTGMKYMGKEEEIQNFITTGTANPSSSRRSGSHNSGIDLSLIILTGAGVVIIDGIMNIQGMVMGSDVLLLYNWLGIRLYFLMDHTITNYDVGMDIEFFFRFKQFCLFAFAGGYPYQTSIDKLLYMGVGGGWFFSLFSPSRRKDCYLEFSLKGVFINYQYNNYDTLNNVAGELSIKFGYCIF